jgi:DNA-binding PucR family transcriptional regulator
LCDTLRAYFGCSQVVTATAAALAVHPRTVAYRLRDIERRLGSSVNRRRAQLEIALALQEIMAVEQPVTAGGLAEHAG